MHNPHPRPRELESESLKRYSGGSYHIKVWRALFLNKAPELQGACENINTQLPPSEILMWLVWDAGWVYQDAENLPRGSNCVAKLENHCKWTPHFIREIETSEEKVKPQSELILDPTKVSRLPKNVKERGKKSTGTLSRFQRKPGSSNTQPTQDMTPSVFLYKVNQ